MGTGMDKVDFKKSLKTLYGPTRSKGIHLVEVPPLRYLMVDGKGDPNTSEAYPAAIAALYAVAYTLKAASKSQLDSNYTVPPLEGLWWAKDMKAFACNDRQRWLWTMMLMVPDWIGPRMIDAAIAKAGQKKAALDLSNLRVEALEEGRAVQVLHIGSYADEAPVIADMHDRFMVESGLVPVGKHHEIYLSDPRKSAPDKLKTILRQPVRAA
jgi:hypothetical protein